MGKSKNKKQIQPFTVFLDEFYKKHQRKYKTKSDAVEDARAEWKDLGPVDQARYKAEAKRLRDIKKNDFSWKKDSYGRPIDYVQKEREAFAQLEKEMKAETRKMVADALASATYLTRKFVVGHFNIFCRDIGDPAKVDYFPAEVGLARFSLGEGLDPRFAHALISPTKFPPGLAADAKESQKDHGISFLDDTSVMNADYDAILADLWEVLDVKGPDGKVRQEPIFVRKDQFHAVRGSLAFLNNQCGKGAGDESLPKLLYLEDLLYALREQAVEYNKQIGRVLSAPIYNINSYLEQAVRLTKFDYASGTACKFHDEMGDPSKCSLGFARQRAFLLMFDVCPLIGRPLETGKHVPDRYVFVDGECKPIVQP